ncbi:uncharacterized protein LOC134855585 [Symsagittifera roscoffensis]|uniref:uncharacterized protein LOC134855585 n=1 Tax=Symsagittifera roscoffensis TaxID=84072 RepID=UPI00307B7C78
MGLNSQKTVLICFMFSLFLDLLLAWESLVFVLPDPKGKRLNRKCAEYGTMFCMYGYLIDSNGMEVQKWDQRYDQVFELLIGRNYRNFNWFSLDEEDHSACCDFQTRLYAEYGRGSGLSPFEYFGRVSDFATKDKKLNYIRARYDECHGNVVTAVGFGLGDLKYVAEDSWVIGGAPHRLAALRPLNAPVTHSDFVLRSDNLETVVTFNFFKRHVLCPEKPWICEEFGPARNALLI